MTLAVAGATTNSSMSEAKAICSMSALAPRENWSVITRRRVIASNVSGPMNRRADRVMTAHDLVAARLQTSGDLDRLIRTDAAGHAEGNQGHALKNLLGILDSPVPSSQFLALARVPFLERLQDLVGRQSRGT